VYRGTPEGRILDCNDAFSRIFGYASRGEYLANTEMDIYLSPDDRISFQTTLKNRIALTNFEHCLRRKDNTPIWVLESATLFETKDDGAASVEGTLIDITERKRAEADLLLANAKLKMRQKEIDQELKLAERVQETLVPKSQACKAGSVVTFYQPARTIGGDFGLVAEGPDYLNVMVCDVSGHGISSALVANRIYTEAMGQIQRGSEFAAMLRHLNRFVLQSFGGEFYCTLAAARVKWNGRILEFAGAGHPPGMIARSGEKPQLLASQSSVLGLLEEAVIGEATIELPLQPGDRLVIYTDGFSECANAQQEMLGIDRLCEIVREASLWPLPEMKQNILDRVAAWQTGPPADDLSLVVVGVL
jgi:PAS domain S-box-containing protein